jgi:hypothetical protein
MWTRRPAKPPRSAATRFKETKWGRIVSGRPIVSAFCEVNVQLAEGANPRPLLPRLGNSESRLPALLGHSKVSLDGVLADDVRIRIARLTILERVELSERPVESLCVSCQTLLVTWPKQRKSKDYKLEAKVVHQP